MRTRVMKEADVAAGLHLNTLAGWNQTAADWRRFIERSPAGCFVTEVDGKVVGTATTICYENRFAWIGMVLVDSEFRKMGIGTQLLHRTIEHLDQIGIPAMKLDATPLGKPLYAKLGFIPEYEIERWILKRAPASLPTTAKTASADLHPAQMEQVCKFDRELFGADRGFLLRSLHEQSPASTHIVWKDGAPQGYAFVRQGLFADHLGPWMAESRLDAQEVLQSFLRQSSRETLIVDCLKSNTVSTELVAACGFSCSRPLTRMVRGPNSYPGRPELFCAILGPEFG